jgi:hypothetical protein
MIRCASKFLGHVLVDEILMHEGKNNYDIYFCKFAVHTGDDVNCIILSVLAGVVVYRKSLCFEGTLYTIIHLQLEQIDHYF